MSKPIRIQKKGGFPYQVGKEESFSFLREERGIAYFEGGWWMHDYDRHKLNRDRMNFIPTYIKANKETKQIEIDKTIYP